MDKSCIKALVFLFAVQIQIVFATDNAIPQLSVNEQQTWIMNIPYLEFTTPSGEKLAYQGKLSSKDGATFSLLADSVAIVAMKQAVTLPALTLQDEWSLSKKSIRLSNGVALRYVELGTSHPETIILLHGYTDSSRSWQQTVTTLQQHYHLIIPDQRGHGDSDKVACCYAVQDFANDIKLLLQDLAIESAIVVGHSMGSFVAQLLAIEQPQLVKKLILIGSAAKAVNNETVAYVWNLAQTFSYPIDPAFIEEWTSNPTPVEKTFLDHIKQETSQVAITTWQKAAQGLLMYDPSRFLPMIHLPTLIIWGDQDVVFPEPDQKLLREAMPSAEFKVYPGIGHNVQWEQGQRVAEDILAFVQK